MKPCETSLFPPLFEAFGRQERAQSGFLPGRHAPARPGRARGSRGGAALVPPQRREAPSSPKRWKIGRKSSKNRRFSTVFDRFWSLRSRLAGASCRRTRSWAACASSRAPTQRRRSSSPRLWATRRPGNGWKFDEIRRFSSFFLAFFASFRTKSLRFRGVLLRKGLSEPCEALALLVLSRRLAFGEPEVPQWQRLAAEGHPEVLVSKPKRLLFKRF